MRRAPFCKKIKADTVSIDRFALQYPKKFRKALYFSAGMRYNKDGETQIHTEVESWKNEK